ncbi:thiamine phosphate synthase [Spirosoma spitsbergense]|uniref:thiamine phosphate synthase n=1 Tax=Spirosoma spitsbergense TaxID=431554 RepID=UPI0003744D7D|nr:thiamine phosphate synthase [Spirosoma spitsbergense]
MNQKPFLLIGITDDSVQSRNHQTLLELLANGLDFIYWRSLASKINTKLFPTHVQASIMFPACEADHVPSPSRWHLKEPDRRQLPAGTTFFSTSIHDLTDWPALAGQAELVFYSPVFDSISKPGYGPANSLDFIAKQVATIRRQHDRLPRLIGLGGVNADNVSLLQQAGFDGAALMGALWQTPDAIRAFKTVKEALHPTIT